MNRTGHICLMADYNAWMNAKLYDAARRLPDEVRVADRKAFFGSIVGTLNHLVVGDTLWLKRFATHPAPYPALDAVRGLAHPTRLDEVLFSDFEALAARRKLLDGVIVEWTRSIADGDLGQVLSFTSMTGVAARKDFFSLLMNFFNHQTHHRGQVTTLLSQAGIDVGVTDLLALIPNEEGGHAG